MFAFLKFILLFLSAVVVISLVIGYSFLRQLYRKIQHFQGYGSRQTGTSSESRRTNSDGNVVIDRRDPKETNRKIIPDDEGEYVDYEENE